jgi:hypothetical protein
MYGALPVDDRKCLNMYFFLNSKIFCIKWLADRQNSHLAGTVTNNEYCWSYSRCNVILRLAQLEATEDGTVSKMVY